MVPVISATILVLNVMTTKPALLVSLATNYREVTV